MRAFRSKNVRTIITNQLLLANKSNGKSRQKVYLIVSSVVLQRKNQKLLEKIFSDFLDFI